MGTKNNQIPVWLTILLVIGGGVLAGLLLSKLFEYLLGTFSTEDEPKPRIFISHSWQNDKDYRSLIGKFKNTGFEFYNHSIPEEKSLDTKSDKELEEKLRNQMIYARRILVLGGKNANRHWIKKEVEIAQELNKQIVVVRPWGEKNVPDFLKKAAHKIVGFNTQAIIETIK